MIVHLKNSFYCKAINNQRNNYFFKIMRFNFCLKKSINYKNNVINEIWKKNISFEKIRKRALNNYNSFHYHTSASKKKNGSLFDINIRKFSTSGFSEKNYEEKKFDEKYVNEEMKILKEKMKKERLKYKKVIFFIFTSILGVYAYFESYNPEFFLYDLFLKFCLKYVDSELCHDIFLLLGKYNLLPYDTTNDSVYACSEIKNLKFINPFGVAAGFDKNGVCIDSILKLGFSFIEIGTITPREQKGNEKPRIFRDNESKSVINSCGFNNIGCDKVTENLIKFRKKQENDKLLSKHIVGVSIGKNKDTINIIDDLNYCIKKIARYSDYIAINVSSPNTPGLRDNQESEKLKNIILNVKKEINKLEEKSNNNNNMNNYWINTTKEKPLVFVKLAPDLEQNEKKKIAQVLLETEIDGMIISNTTTKNSNIKSFENKKGGVSGEKLKDISTNFISEMYNYTNQKIPIIASGGIFNGKDALEKIEAGASICQLYSCLIFNGMKSAIKIKREFNNLLYQKGYYNLKEAIGKKHRNKKMNK
ncbi:dihydroorotate dehydrogenase, mitochondrial precursor, putative [Plasmodium relictum]|uniref:Dihydroorotate dehydrogenase (quinone), mitochondrial n=1 Tax=Plasmodium relictum TaxID=85471 RepID=A0A1J1H8Y8_PLARL|nr:dihydroorotate dehydrogenase, mitochondrial precursor, putative [Plasmodium relictum]CRH01101.1 dihydroorotate dehydrogenase, mitochondrial precursor, putative [Plasmodium relictum]